MALNGTAAQSPQQQPCEAEAPSAEAPSGGSSAANEKGSGHRPDKPKKKNFRGDVAQPFSTVRQ